MQPKMILLLIFLPLCLVAQDKIYWGDSQTNDIRRADLDGTNLEILIAGQNTPRGIQIDIDAGHFYWMDGQEDAVKRADLDGRNIVDIVTGLTEAIDLTLDLTNGFIYFTDNGADRIYRSKLDGTDQQVIIDSDQLTNPTGIALDLNAGKIYWADFTLNTINRADLDGNNIETVLTNASTSDIELNVNAGKIYFCDRAALKVRSVNFDGTGLQDLQDTDQFARGISLDIPNSHVYWTEPQSDRISRIDLDGSNFMIVVSGVPNVGATALALSTGEAFVNVRTGEAYQNLQEAIDGAEDGDEIIVRARVPPPGGTIPRNKKITLSNPEGESVEYGDLIIEGDLTLIGNMTIQTILFEGGTLETRGDFEVGNAEGETPSFHVSSGAMGVYDINVDGIILVEPGAGTDFGTLRAPATKRTTLIGEVNANLVNVEEGSIFIQEGILRTRETEGGVPGGGLIEASTIKKTNRDQVIFEAVAGSGENGGLPRSIPFGFLNEETGDEYYTPIGTKVKARPPSLDRLRLSGGGPGSVEEVFGSSGQNNITSTTVPSNGISTDFVDLLWDISLLDEAGTPVDGVLDLAFYFPTESQLGQAVMENPVVVNLHEGERIYYLGEATQGMILENGQEVAHPGFNKVLITEVSNFSPFAIFGCPSCGENKVQICKVPKGNPSKAKTKCISKESLINHLNNGSYCGPCQEAAGLVAQVGDSFNVSSQRTHQGLQVYPNPVTDQLTIAFEVETTTSLHLRLVDLNGRMLRKQVVEIGAFTTQMNVEGLPAGIYVLQVQDGAQSRQFKVMVK